MIKKAIHPELEKSEVIEAFHWLAPMKVRLADSADRERTRSKSVHQQKTWQQDWRRGLREESFDSWLALLKILMQCEIPQSKKISHNFVAQDPNF